MIKPWGTKKTVGIVGVSMALLAATALGIPYIGQLAGISDGGALLPSLAFAAPADGLPATFDESLAGFSAYLKLGTAIDIDKIKTALSSIRGESANHVLGKVRGGDFLYADKSGWLVAYWHRANPSSQIAAWTASGVPKLGSTPGHAPLVVALEALGLDYEAAKQDVKYYHWAYPSATQAVVLVRGTVGTTATMTFEVSSQYVVDEASWSGIGGSFSYYTFKLNDEVFAGGGVRAKEILGFATDKPYVFELDPNTSTTRIGVAVFLILQ
jgi:hypothetical protein